MQRSLIAALLMLAAPAWAEYGDWPQYGGDPGSTRYSPLTQITPDNVARLKQAWIFHTGDISPGGSANISPERQSDSLVAFALR